MRCEGQIAGFGYAHVEFPRALRYLSYTNEKCSGVENDVNTCVVPGFMERIQPIPRDSKDNGLAAMLVYNNKRS